MNFQEPYGGHLGNSILAGIAASTMLFYGGITITPLDSWIVFLLAFVGGLFPDLDTHSTPSKWAARAGAVGIILCLWFDYLAAGCVIGLVFALTKCGKHRGWTHSIALPAFIAAFFSFLGYQPYGIAFAIGLLFHIASDDIYSKLKKNGHF